MPAAVVALGFVLLIVATDLVLGYLEILRVTRAQHLIQAGSPYIDVDPPERFAVEHPRGSINMPYPWTDWLARGLDRSKPLVIHGHRMRAMRAARKLRARGFQVVALGPARIESF